MFELGPEGPGLKETVLRTGGVLLQISTDCLKSSNNILLLLT